MKLTVIESPLRGDGSRSMAENLVYARACLLDSLYRGEAPIASHLLHPQVLDDTVSDQREMGIQAGLAWADRADLGAFYLDHGESEGMRRARDFYAGKGIPIEERYILKADDPEERCRHCGGAGSVCGLGGCAPCKSTGRVLRSQQCRCRGCA